eukprot:1196204-Prorocentrum_minimum.AAC.3
MSEENILNINVACVNIKKIDLKVRVSTFHLLTRPGSARLRSKTSIGWLSWAKQAGVGRTGGEDYRGRLAWQFAHVNVILDRSGNVVV